MKKDVYDKLAAALNARSMTYPSVPCDEFYTLMAELFSPEQAEIATYMPLEPVSAQELSEKIKEADAAKLTKQLDEMAERGLVRVKEISGKKLYELMPFVPGIVELQFMHGRTDERTKRLAQLFKSYAKAMRNAMLTMPSPAAAAEPAPAKKISVEQEIHDRSTVLPYDEVIKLIDKTEYVAVGTCVCRHQGDLLDRPCDKPKENLCMILGPSAHFAQSHGFVRLISKEEARNRIDEAEEAGLVHNYANTHDRYIDLLCNCCGCHCLILRGAKRSPVPSQAVIAEWIMNIDSDACIGCEACISRCWMEALKMDDDVPVRDANRCIGCGICAYVCPSDAMKLVPREKAAV
ncbi:MAG TPA: 4Fe-4S dicluster domain-containing protein [Dehalococcoidia bacterium]|jgi:ferredoxin/predicted transcriptional regulator